MASRGCPTSRCCAASRSPRSSRRGREKRNRISSVRSMAPHRNAHLEFTHDRLGQMARARAHRRASMRCAGLELGGNRLRALLWWRRRRSLCAGNARRPVPSPTMCAAHQAPAPSRRGDAARMALQYKVQTLRRLPLRRTAIRGRRPARQAAAQLLKLLIAHGGEQVRSTASRCPWTRGSMATRAPLVTSALTRASSWGRTRARAARKQGAARSPLFSSYWDLRGAGGKWRPQATAAHGKAAGSMLELTAVRSSRRGAAWRSSRGTVRARSAHHGPRDAPLEEGGQLLGRPLL